MKKYKSCEVCDCGDCKEGTYRSGSWYCPILKKQICDVCCWYDSKDINGVNLSKKCESIKCKYYYE